MINKEQEYGDEPLDEGVEKTASEGLFEALEIPKDQYLEYVTAHQKVFSLEHIDTDHWRESICGLFREKPEHWKMGLYNTSKPTANSLHWKAITIYENNYFFNNFFKKRIVWKFCIKTE